MKEHAKKCASLHSCDCGGMHGGDCPPPEDCDCDGFHTFGELYDHRISLWIQVCSYAWIDAKNFVWRSKNHSDGEPAFGGTWFLLGIGKEKGEQMTYHLPIDRWDECEFADTLDKAPEFDGHTSDDVLERLKSL